MPNNFYLKKVSEIFYDHWKIVFPTLLPFVAVGLLSVWKNFRDLMLIPIPFWILFIVLVILGILLIWIMNLQSTLKAKQQATQQTEINLVDNLIYKSGDRHTYCPACFEKKGELKKMKVIDRDDDTDYECFVCGYHGQVDKLPIPF
ncbi:MAG: hypothetical protein G01um101433_366 [Parcubacteria group bacterium Gr01-1014_33]|nr:MAG: hypothetical protein G01um101433_366 [Parcubacteria group bacterium Gr01-1014_33]